MPPEQRMMRKVYEIVREYWQKHGDTDRLALTDEQLDEQFWLIDYEGIPRLKTEQGTITLPPDPLEALIGLLGDGPEDLSESVRGDDGSPLQKPGFNLLTAVKRLKQANAKPRLTNISIKL